MQKGTFRYEYLWGFQIGKTRITPMLPIKLWRNRHNIYLCSINGRFALPLTYIVARLRGKPFILWTGIWHNLQTPFHRLIYPLTRFIYRHADAVVVYGEHVKRFLIGEGVVADNIFVASHAVDNEAYRHTVHRDQKEVLRQELNIRPDQQIVLFIGRLEEVKGIDYLLKAFAHILKDQTVLVIGGAGSQKGFLQMTATRLGISDRVRFTGYVPIDRSEIFYAIADVFALPSVTTPSSKELWGLVVNEAFNQGVPVIATEAVGAAAGGLVEDGINGFIVPERDSEALAIALARLLDDPALREEMGRNARTKIASWNQAQMVQSFQRAFEYVLSAK